MNNFKIWLAILLVALLGCAQNDVFKNKSGSGIVGRWRLFKIDGSTGTSKFTTPIPAKPLQALTFTDQGRVSKQGTQLDDYYDRPFYRIDSAGAYHQLWFLANEKDTTGFVVGLSIRGDSMYITPTCYEGCGASFVRIE